MHPQRGTNTFGREGFFIHGGREPGTAGCIDIGKHDIEFYNLLRKHKEPINVFVIFSMGFPLLGKKKRFKSSALKRGVIWSIILILLFQLYVLVGYQDVMLTNLQRNLIAFIKYLCMGGFFGVMLCYPSYLVWQDKVPIKETFLSGIIMWLFFSIYLTIVAFTLYPGLAKDGGPSFKEIARYFSGGLLAGIIIFVFITGIIFLIRTWLNKGTANDKIGNHAQHN